MTRRIVGLFAKPVEEGRVKTRLVPPLTSREAAALYAAFLADAASTVAGASGDWCICARPTSRAWSRRAWI